MEQNLYLDIWHNVSKFLSEEELFPISLVSKELYNNLKFNKIKNNISIFHIKNNNINILKWLYYYFNFNFKISDFLLSCSIGDINTVKWFLNIDKTFETYKSNAYIVSCQNGKINLSKWFYQTNNFNSITKGDAFIKASESGHLEIIKWMANNNYDFVLENRSLAFKFASAKGHLDIVEWLYEEPIYNNDIELINNSFYEACENGHVLVAKFLFEKLLKYVDDMDEIINDAFIAACENNKVNIIIWLIQFHKNTINIISCFALACEYGSLDIVNYLYSNNLIDRKDLDILNQAFNITCIYGHYNIILWFLELKNYQPNLAVIREGINNARNHKKFYTAQLLENYIKKSLI
jgi:hypothetical protein